MKSIAAEVSQVALVPEDDFSPMQHLYYSVGFIESEECSSE